MARVRHVGLKFSKEKSQIKALSVKYLGCNMFRNGINVSEKRVQAILYYKIPKNKTALQRFIKFVPILWNKTVILRQLLSSAKEFIWIENETKVFKGLKVEIINAPVIAFFDSNKKSAISVDISQYD